MRITGLQILLSIASRTFGGNNASYVAARAAIPQSGCEAEHETNSYAVKTVSAAHIDPMGLAGFFRKMLASQAKYKSVGLSKLGSIFSNHTVRQERISKIKPPPAGSDAIGMLTPTQRQDPKSICH